MCKGRWLNRIRENRCSSMKRAYLTRTLFMNIFIGIMLIFNLYGNFQNLYDIYSLDV